MTTIRIDNLKRLTEHARDVLHETHMEMHISLVLELVEAAKGEIKPPGPLATIEEFAF